MPLYTCIRKVAEMKREKKTRRRNENVYPASNVEKSGIYDRDRDVSNLVFSGIKFAVLCAYIRMFLQESWLRYMEIN